VIVELSRLLVTLTITGLGFQIGRSVVDWAPSLTSDRELATIIGAILGAGLGYLLGGALGRTIRSGLDRAPMMFSKTTGPELFAGAFGVVTGIMVGVVVAVPIVVLLPPLAGWALGALIVIVAAAFGGRIFAVRSHDLLSVAGLRSREPLRPSHLDEPGEGTRFVIDSSAAIDGRILELARSGLLIGTVWVPGFVVDELQEIADSSDRDRRRRGRRGLDMLDALRDVPSVRFTILEDSIPEHHEVDAKLLAIAGRSGATLVTSDHNLARSAELRDITVVNPHALSESMRPDLETGQLIELKLEREGSEEGQGVGFLDDGTMVVVEGASAHIGQTVAAEVSNSLRTSVGRMLFARLQA